MIDAHGKGADPYQGGSDGRYDRKTGTRRERREQTRAALLAAARRLWAERGIHGASLDDVAAAAGLTKGAVYSNFSGKTDLLLALLDHWTADLEGTEIYTGLRETADSDEDRFDRSGRTYARCIATENSRLMALLLVEFWLYGMRDRTAGRRIADWYAERRASLARTLHETDGIRAQDRASMAVAFDFGFALQHLLDPDRVPADLYAEGMHLVLGKSL